MLPLLRRAGDASLWSCVATRVRADMEFMAAPSDHNVQDHIAWLGAWADQTHEAQDSRQNNLSNLVVGLVRWT